MTQRKVVFVGKKRELALMEPMHRIFEAHRWLVQDCTSIAKAKLFENADLLVVYALDDYFVEPFKKWKKHPRTIWCHFSMFNRRIPPGVKTLPSTMRPNEFFEGCLSQLSVNH